MDSFNRERWRKCNWGYPPEFLQAEREFLGIEPKAAEAAINPKGVTRDEMAGFRADLRHAVNRLNEHIDKSQKHGSSAF